MLGFRKRRLFNESLVGKTVNVLFEHEQEPGTWSGLTEQYVRVIVKSGDSIENQILPVQVTAATNENCIGKLTKPTEGERDIASCADVLRMDLA